jgi:alpha-glucosidase
MADPDWWQRAVLYQIYPRSFRDADGDGVGDIAGICKRLDHLVELGVDALWLSPVFPSPMADFGYDVADYCDIDPLFGSLADFDTLLADAHARGLKVVLDLVANHTSDQHPWFQESRASRTSPKRDWYIWRDPAPGGGPPNNWLSEFGGGAWEYDAASGQYYLHTFLTSQPDLNWRNPGMRDAMYEVVRFWLKRGVDGFRADAIRHLIKDDAFRDNPPNPAYRDGDPPDAAVLPLYTADRPEAHDVIAGLRGVIDEFPDRLLIGELNLPFEKLVIYYGRELGGLHLPFNFALLSTPWHARHLAGLIDRYEAALPQGGWPNWVLGNHDKPRIASRVGDAQAKVAAMLLLTLRGMPTLYYGDEIGMHDVEIPPERVQDPLEKNVPGKGLGRDPARTPMQWDHGPNAGFCPQDAEPWLPVANDYRRYNVAAERTVQRSMLALYRRLLALRRAELSLAVGSYEPVEATGDFLLAYARETDGCHFLIVLNFGHEPTTFDPGGHGALGRIVLSTHLDRDGEKVDGALELRGDEGVILELD